ncbi:hypothetical protein AB0N77_09610 [Streptomyces misionensis]|uniref:zinc finger domain-containing protein n=1 Tax=Streptomyces misionensis TaxID=67331 RepID=UPI00341F37CF
MPDSLRNILTTTVSHPARQVPCPHCKATVGKPCVLRTNGRTLPEPHHTRIAAWEQSTA